MIGWLLASLLSGTAAVVAWTPSPRHRLASVGLTAPGDGDVLPGRSGAGPSFLSPVAPGPWSLVVLDVSLVVVVAALLPAPVGVVLAIPVAAVGHRWLVRLPGRGRVADRVDARRQLPLVLELVAAGLRAGSTTETAVALAAGGAGPAVASVLHEVVAGLRLGAPADEAWRPALGVEGFDALARVAIRSQASGAALAEACSDLARRERAHRHLAAQAAVKRAGVWAVLPLAGCFLPAFVLVGVVPAVVGLLQSIAW